MKYLSQKKNRLKPYSQYRQRSTSLPGSRYNNIVEDLKMKIRRARECKT